MPPNLNEWIPFLSNVYFFSSFNADQLAHVFRNMLPLSLPTGAVLFRQGDPGDALYIIGSGRLRLTSQSTGQEKTMAYLGRGDCLGEMALLSGEPRSVTAVVDSTVELLVLYKKDFDPLLKKKPALAVHISRLLSLRLSERDVPVPAPAQTSKIMAILAPVPLADRIIFTANLAISLTEQTRRKVLLLDATEENNGLTAKAMGLSPVRVAEHSIRQEDLQNPDLLRRLKVAHPSGLELMNIPLPLLTGKFLAVLFPFFSQLKKQHGLTLLLIPPNPGAWLEKFLPECDRVIWVETADAEGLNLKQTVLQGVPPEKITHVTLGSRGKNRKESNNVAIPWPAEVRRLYDEKKSPFFGPEAMLTGRWIDRLARQLTGLSLGLALGSGAAFGYTLIGILRVLERNNIFPDVLSGTSMGALIGAFYASGKTVDELEDIAKSITRARLYSLLDLTLPRQGLLIGGKVLQFLQSILGEKTFEELELPFACVATDIVSGEEVVIKSGAAAEAVRASLSLPFFFQPYFLKGRYLVDGGLVNPVPTSVLATLGADLFLAVNLTCKPSQKHLLHHRQRTPRAFSFWKGPNILEVLSKTIYTMQFGIAQARAEIAHVLLSPDLTDFTWSDFHRSPDIIKLGEDTAEEALPKIKSLLPFFQDHCRVTLKKPSPPSF